MLTAAALLGSAALSSAAQMAINKANIKNQSNINDTSIQLANTQHQREVADLRLAGLNPILSAQGSGASVPSLGITDQKSIADSLPSTAREVARYASDAYKEGVVSQQLSNQYQGIVNSAAESERAASAIRAQIDIEQAEAEQEALRAEMGTTYGKDGEVYFDRRQYRRYLDLAREGIRSDLKNRANSNLRNWIPFMSGATGAANSASKAANTVKWLLK